MIKYVNTAVAIVQFAPAVLYYAIGNYWLAGIWSVVTWLWLVVALISWRTEPRWG